ncbi:hypothetical protein [Bacillus altitudinis]|nr:hypothetical protein [Bacillus altitudinis]
MSSKKNKQNDPFLWDSWHTYHLLKERYGELGYNICFRLIFFSFIMKSEDKTI